MTIGTPHVTARPTQCRLTITQVPPDATTGWSVQFRRGSGTTIGYRVTEAPYTRTKDPCVCVDNLGGAWR